MSENKNEGTICSPIETNSNSIQRSFTESGCLPSEEELVRFLELSGHYQIVVLRNDLQR